MAESTRQLMPTSQMERAARSMFPPGTKSAARVMTGLLAQAGTGPPLAARSGVMEVAQSRVDKRSTMVR
jgi:hypothetical protein